MDGNRLHSFDSGRSRQKAPGSAYTRFVKLAKVLLPVAALAIVGVVIVRLTQNPLQGVADVPQAEKTTPGRIDLVKAQYEGVDDQGHAYTLIADHASRSVADPDSVDLGKLKADITLADKSWLAVNAAGGTYATKAEHLVLTGEIEIFHDSGYSMKLTDLDVDMKTRHATAKNPVHAQGPIGELTAANMEVTDSGDLILFGGPAKLTFYHFGSGRG